MQIIIFTGQAGSGKSTAIRAIEDAGYYCVDNMPISMLPELIQTLEHDAQIDKLGLVIDLRDPTLLQTCHQTIEQLRASAHTLRIIYLETDIDTLIRRYSSTRRKHPLDANSNLREAVTVERKALEPLRELADDTINTTQLTPHALRSHILREIAQLTPADTLKISVISFGFKYGIPLEADIVLDVRFLPNPYFIPHLQAKPGTDAEVKNYVLTQSEAQTFLHKTIEYLEFLIPHYQAEGKRYLTLAIGCTGGRHRSVALATELAQHLQRKHVTVDLQHKNILDDPK